MQEEALEKKSKQLAAERYLREQQQLALEQKQLVKRRLGEMDNVVKCIFLVLEVQCGIRL
jgi:hypothetical protein